MSITALGQLTISDLNDGIHGVLSNDSAVIATSSTGEGGSYSGCSTTMSILVGGVNDTSNWTFTASASEGITGVLNGSTYTVSNLSAAYDTGYVDITASKFGTASITKRFSIAKSKAGEKGDGFATNLNKKTSFSDGSSGTWGVPVELISSTHCIKSTTRDLLDGYAFDVIPGETLLIRASVNRSQSSYGGNVGVAFKDSSGNWCAWRGVYSPAGGSTFVELSGTIVVPTGAVTGYAWLQIDAYNVTFGSVYLSYIYINRAAPKGDIGPVGPRGNVQVAVYTTATAWDDTLANDGLTNAGYGSPKLKDIVTLYNGDGFSKSKLYNGDAWEDIAQWLNGALIVNGTISGNALITKTVTSDQINGTNLDIVNGTFSGSLNGATGTFAGSLSAATGTFAGSLQAGVLDLTTMVGQSTTYTTPGTYTVTVPSNLGTTSVTMRVTLQGAGGTGNIAARDDQPGGVGGGAGGNVKFTLIGVTPGTTYTLVVGQGAASYYAYNGGGTGSAGGATTMAGYTASGGIAGGGIPVTLESVELFGNIEALGYVGGEGAASLWPSRWYICS